jgi:hypothetical protein
MGPEMNLARFLGSQFENHGVTNLPPLKEISSSRFGWASKELRKFCL